jgi:hypothetical protein
MERIRTMPLARTLLLGLALACASLAPAHAALIIDLVLTPTNVFGSPPFGIGELPAGPFAARFTLDEPLPADFSGGLEVDDFAATVGNQTWELDDLAFVNVGTLVRGIIVSTDATGAITRLSTAAREGARLLEIGFGDATDLDWQASEGACGNECVSGTASLSVRLADEVPEPATLALLAGGLATFAAMRRRQTLAIV